jgi:hypothetical protein
MDWCHAIGAMRMGNRADRGDGAADVFEERDVLVVVDVL